MAEERKPIPLTVEEAAKIDPKEIAKGISVGEGEVEAQSFIVVCKNCGNRYRVYP